mmetsp:Transcript_48579/g.105317  ORF Transcript_48579/g.105317 Transcript_48579/m.105317 type:complete len:300 (-) Transcript_48579:146-1045(-)
MDLLGSRDIYCALVTGTPETVGPGSYETRNMRIHQRPSGSSNVFKSGSVRAEQLSHTWGNPSPAQYHPKDQSSINPVAAFRSRPRRETDLYPDKQTPGPGAYDIASAFRPRAVKSKSTADVSALFEWSRCYTSPSIPPLSQRCLLEQARDGSLRPQQTVQPGPAHYNPNDSPVARHATSSNFGASLGREQPLTFGWGISVPAAGKSATFNVAPGQYYMMSENPRKRQLCKGSPFASGVARLHTEAVTAPPPGRYEPARGVGEKRPMPKHLQAQRKHVLSVDEKLRTRGYSGDSLSICSS